MGEGAALVYTVGAGGAVSQSYITSSTDTGFTTFYAGLSLQLGATVSVSTITKATIKKKIRNKNAKNILAR